MSVHTNINMIQNPSIDEIIPPDGLELEIVVGEYYLRQGRFLGKGAFGTCYVYIDLKTNKEYCLKVVPKKLLNCRERNQLRNEIEVQKNLNHEGIVKLYHNFGDYLNHYLLLELVDGFTLRDVLLLRKSLTEPEVRYYIFHILSTLEYIHQKGYIHRDLKLDNLLLTKDCKIKICDFGLSAELTPDKTCRRTMCGTPSFLAPEVLMKKGYGSEVDLWAVGVITFACLFGDIPFTAKGQRLLFAKIVASEYKFSEDKNVSEQAKDFIENLLQVDTNRRPNIRTLSSYSFLNKRSIPKALDPIALTSDPGLVLRTFDDENEESIKKQRCGFGLITRKPPKRHGKYPFSPVFNSLYKIRETSEVILNEARFVVESSKAIPIFKADVNDDLPRFVSKISVKQGIPVAFQMSDGTVGITIQNELTIIRKPTTCLFLLYERFKGSETEYVASYHTSESFLSINPNLYNIFMNEIAKLKNIDGIFDPEPIDSNDYTVDDIETAAFPLRVIKVSKFDMYVLSDSTIQIPFSTSSHIIIEGKAKRVSFLHNKVVRTFGIQEFLSAVLKSGITLKNPKFVDLITSEFNAAALPEIDTNKFNFNLEKFSYCFEASFSAMLYCLQYKGILRNQ